MFLTANQLHARALSCLARHEGTPNAIALQPLVAAEIDWLFLIDRVDAEQGVCGMPAIIVEVDVLPNETMKFTLAFNTDAAHIYSYTDVPSATLYGESKEKMAWCSFEDTQKIRQIIERHQPMHALAQPTLAEA